MWLLGTISGNRREQLTASMEEPIAFPTRECCPATESPAPWEALGLYKTLCSQRTHSLAGDTKPTDGKQLPSNGA